MGYLGCFQFLTITNKASVNIVEHVSLWYGRKSFGYMSKSGIAGSSGRSIYNFLRNHQIDFQSGCTSLQSYHVLSQHMLSLEFLILAILTGEVNLRVDLFPFISISLITKDVTFL